MVAIDIFGNEKKLVGPFELPDIAVKWPQKDGDWRTTSSDGPMGILFL
jgi:hypothetical protein